MEKTIPRTIPAIARPCFLSLCLNEVAKATIPSIKATGDNIPVNENTNDNIAIPLCPFFLGEVSAFTVDSVIIPFTAGVMSRGGLNFPPPASFPQI
jgi:hypothetical protein